MGSEAHRRAEDAEAAVVVGRHGLVALNCCARDGLAAGRAGLCVAKAVELPNVVKGQARIVVQLGVCGHCAAMVELPIGVREQRVAGLGTALGSILRVEDALALLLLEAQTGIASG